MLQSQQAVDNRINTSNKTADRRAIMREYQMSDKPIDGHDLGADPDAALIGTPGPGKLRVILIAPDKRMVVECFIDRHNTLKEMYRLIECQTVDVVRTVGSDWGAANDGQAAVNVDLWVDDEGLMVTPTEDAPVHLVYLPGAPTPLAGRVMMAGSNDAGETISLPDWITTEYVQSVIVGRTHGGAG